MVWYGVVWCGMVWCGVVWYDMVWCGVVWCGVAWHMKELDPSNELDWFTHWRWWPDLSMPNTADYVICMDTYAYTNTMNYVNTWLSIYQCQVCGEWCMVNGVMYI